MPASPGWRPSVACAVRQSRPGGVQRKGGPTLLSQRCAVESGWQNSLDRARRREARPTGTHCAPEDDRARADGADPAEIHTGCAPREAAIGGTRARLNHGVVQMREVCSPRLMSAPARHAAREVAYEHSLGGGRATRDDDRACFSRCSADTRRAVQAD